MYNALRVGSTIIEEILEREVKKQEDEERRQEREKAESEAHKQKVRCSFARWICIIMSHAFAS